MGISTARIFSVYLSVFNYLADTYQQYASSVCTCYAEFLPQHAWGDISTDLEASLQQPGLRASWKSIGGDWGRINAGSVGAGLLWAYHSGEL